ncbi:uncharacterized protein BYT42DRAFT_293592 [Radiomyces spectabilis]|uniref:uncharacterized protein n=1 Tax=Radiomyces spectabilis TaxID=64574 RepID=UPI00221EA23B|nr:uncharacterized protein BYT42DRAFT_293592 [Radiomyces spectabilis]KAI8381132.1 hypothetical protein BYT42DRAFT_293592 [Radiomyces spectabilis]
MPNSPPSTPHSFHSQTQQELTPSGITNGALPQHYPKSARATGESMACLVGASLTAVGDAVYVFGGFDRYSDEVFNNLYKLTRRDQHQYEWQCMYYIKEKAPSKRNDHSATLWRKDKLIIYGGTGEDEEEYYADIIVLDLQTMTWIHPTTTGYQPEGRVKHSATIYDDKLYIAGGLTRHNQYAETLLILDLITWEWQKPIPFVCCFQHITFMYNGRLYLFGGFHVDMSRSNHLSFIDMDRHTVTHLEIDSSSAPPLAGQRFSQICGDQLVVLVTDPVSQASAETKMTTGVWHLDLPSMQWQYHDIPTRCENQHWHYFAMAEHDTFFYLFGADDDDPDEYYSVVLRMDLKEYGIVPVPPPQLGSDLVGLLFQQSAFGQQTADFSIHSTIEPERGEIRVHRLVMVARWPHFTHLLDSGMVESLNSSLTLPEPFSVLEAFVRFLYTDTLDESLSTDLVSDLLVMANLYQLPRLLALCVRRLHSGIDVEVYFGQVCRTAGYRDLPLSIMYDILDELPQNAAIHVRARDDHLLHYCNGDSTSQALAMELAASVEDQSMPMEV